MGKLTKSGDDWRHPAAPAPPLATSHTVKGLTKQEILESSVRYSLDKHGISSDICYNAQMLPCTNPA